MQRIAILIVVNFLCCASQDDSAVRTEILQHAPKRNLHRCDWERLCSPIGSDHEGNMGSVLRCHACKQTTVAHPSLADQSKRSELFIKSPKYKLHSTDDWMAERVLMSYIDLIGRSDVTKERFQNEIAHSVDEETRLEIVKALKLDKNSVVTAVVGGRTLNSYLASGFFEILQVLGDKTSRNQALMQLIRLFNILHVKMGIAWGDGHLGNILWNEGTQKFGLIDFGQSCLESMSHFLWTKELGVFGTKHMTAREIRELLSCRTTTGVFKSRIVKGGFASQFLEAANDHCPQPDYDLRWADVIGLIRTLGDLLSVTSPIVNDVVKVLLCGESSDKYWVEESHIPALLLRSKERQYFNLQKTGRFIDFGQIYRTIARAARSVTSSVNFKVSNVDDETLVDSQDFSGSESTI